MGPIPPGYELVRDEQNNVTGMRLIPNSPAAAEAERAATATRVRTENTQRTGVRMIDAIDRAEEIIRTSTLPTTGLFADRLASIGGTGARDLAGSLRTIQSNIGFDELNRMRQESPTGGALGNVSNQEIAYLQAVQGDVGQSQSEGELRRNLRRLREAYLEVIHYGLGNRPPVQLPGPGNRGTAEPPRGGQGTTTQRPGEMRTPGGITIRPIQ